MINYLDEVRKQTQKKETFCNSKFYVSIDDGDNGNVGQYLCSRREPA